MHMHMRRRRGVNWPAHLYKMQACTFRVDYPQTSIYIFAAGNAGEKNAQEAECI